MAHEAVSTVKRIFRSKRILGDTSLSLFGGLATIVNFVSFALARQYFDLSMALSNSISWFCSVLFAFVTNKLWVFHSKSPNFTHALIECGKFFFYRILSYGLDMGAMVLLINVMNSNEYVAKSSLKLLLSLRTIFSASCLFLKKLRFLKKK